MLHRGGGEPKEATAARACERLQLQQRSFARAAREHSVQRARRLPSLLGAAASAGNNKAAAAAHRVQLVPDGAGRLQAGAVLHQGVVELLDTRPCAHKKATRDSLILLR